jgi:TonB family protein
MSLPRIAAAFCLALFLLSTAAFAQQPQLSLADFVIGLRSKKVTLPERNKLLTEAAKARGVTFVLTPEIEKELENTGADKELIDAIRQKGAIVKASATVPVKVDPAPAAAAAAPPPPDRAFYVNRAKDSFGKGDLDPSIADWTKAIEFNAGDPSDFIGRGMAFYNRKSYDEAIADFNKAIEIRPSSMAYVNRGFAFEKKGSPEKAMADFQKAVDLDAANESAKINLKRLQDDQAKIDAKIKEAEAAAKAASPAATSSVRPDSIELGALSSSQAVRLIKPVYSAVAMRTGIEGKVIVKVSLDEDGNVKTAVATSGPSFLRQAAEDAARRSKFKPAVLNNLPIKATGLITYNFSKGQEE